MPDGVQIAFFNASAAKKYLREIAQLRMTVFRDFPYLYDGNLAYEEKYLETYFRSPRAGVILCQRDGEVVGASTVIPLADEDDALKVPFAVAGFDVEEIMYFGESVLLNSCRGLGIGKAFFQERLAHARRTPGITKAAFCAVVRAPEHPLRPAAYRPLTGLWESFGFKEVPGLTCSMSWKQIDEASESAKTLQFWLRDLP